MGCAMTGADVLADSFERVRDLVHRAVDELSPDHLSVRLDPEANSIGWLLWHLTRIQDDHVAAVAATEQVWTSAGWAQRFDLPLDVSGTGYGHTSQQVAAVISTPTMLGEYHDAVCDRTLEFVRRLTDADLDRVVDTRWKPPVTLGVRLVSVVVDDVEHAGQAAYIRGILDRGLRHGSASAPHS
jgi:uncharacterized damage-inducible protein DinB